MKWNSLTQLERIFFKFKYKISTEGHAHCKRIMKFMIFPFFASTPPHRNVQLTSRIAGLKKMKEKSWWIDLFILKQSNILGRWRHWVTIFSIPLYKQQKTYEAALGQNSALTMKWNQWKNPLENFPSFLLFNFVVRSFSLTRDTSPKKGGKLFIVMVTNYWSIFPLSNILWGKRNACSNSSLSLHRTRDFCAVSLLLLLYALHTWPIF